MNDLVITPESTEKAPTELKPDVGADNLRKIVKANIAVEPAEAAKNIDRSNFYEMSPDQYSKNKESFDPEFESIDRVPSSLEENTRKFGAQSDQHAALVKDDYSKLNFIEKRIKYYDERIIELPNLRREANELYRRKMNDDFDETDQEYLDDLNITMSDMQERTYGIDGEGEQFVVEVFSAVGDMARSYYENKGIIAGATAAGAGVGGLATLGVPIPGARVVGAGAGAAAGFTSGIALASYVDAFQETSASTYGELENAVNEQGESLNLEPERMKQVSYGVGILSGVAAGVSGKILSSKNPLMKKFISSKTAAKTLSQSPALLAKMQILGSIATTVGSEGTEEAFQELVQIVGVNFGKMDESEASFTNAINNAVTDLETWQQVGKAGLLGGVTGGVIQGASGALAYKRNKTNINESQEMTRVLQKKRATEEMNNKTLEKQNSLTETVAAIKSTKVDKLAPNEINKFIKSLIGVDQEVMMSIEDMKEFADTPEKGALLNKYIDPKVLESANELNTVVSINESDAVRIMVDEPTFSDYLKLDPDSKNPKEIRTESQDFVSRLDEAQTRRDEIESNLGVDQKMSPDEQLELEAMLEPETSSIKKIRKQSQEINAQIFEVNEEIRTATDGTRENVPVELQTKLDDLLGQREGVLQQYDEFKATRDAVQNEQQFYDDIRFEPIEGIVSEEDVQILNTKELDARLEIANALNEESDAKSDRIDNRIIKDVDAKDVESQIKALDKEFKIISRFTDSKEVYKADSIESDRMSAHKKKGYGPLAIDPKSLPEDLKEIYFRTPNDNIKKRKVFVEGGIDIEEAAGLAGLDSGADLLKMLSETPTKSEIKNKRAQRKIELENRVKQTTDRSRQTRRDEAFTKITQLRLKQMDYFKNNEWTTLKRGVIKIAGRTPTVEGLNRKAKNVVGKTLVKDLNPRKFESGEINSRKKATESWLKTEFEQSYKHTEASALNNELRKETINAKEKIAKAEKFWKKLDSPTMQKTLKDSGLLKAMNEFTDVYKMTNSGKGLTELKSFEKFIRKQDERGDFTPNIPERLNDVTQSSKEMTVEQYVAITEMGQYIANKARLKNKLLKAQADRTELQTQEKVSLEVEEATKSHPSYNTDKAKQNLAAPKNATEAFMRQVKKRVATSMSIFSSIKSNVAELDNYQFGGYFQKMIGEPIKVARDAKRQEMYDVEALDRSIINEYGEKEFKDMYNTFVDVKEFKDIATLGDGDGKIKKIELLTLMAYMGDPEGRRSVENFVTSKGNRLTVDQVKKVLDEHLTDRDAALVQSLMVDRFKRFEDRSFELHKKTAGVEPTMVKGVGIEHKGKTLPGGYYPISRQIMPDDLKAAGYMDKIKSVVNTFSGDESEFFATLRSAEMTDQGRLKERTGSKRPLDLTFDNVFKFTEEAIHDLNFRETGIDILSMMKNPNNVRNMKSVLGAEKYVNLLNSVKDVVSKTTEQESSLFADEFKKINSWVGNLHSLHAVKTIGFNLGSAMIQPDALLTLGLRAGPKSNLYVMKAAKKMIANPMMFNDYATIAEQINPDIKFEKDNIDAAIVKDSYDFIPNSQNFMGMYNTNLSQKAAKVSDMKQKLIDSSFAMVREGDRINKIIATHALSEQFMNGDVKGWDSARLEKMSIKDRAAAMKTTVRQILDLSLTANAPEDKTAIEKNKVAKIFARYWVDRRNRLNSLFSQMQQAGDSIKQGEYKQASGYLLNTALVSGISISFMNAVRNGLKDEYKELKKVDSAEEGFEMAGEVMWHFAKAPVSQIADLVPFIDSINYASGMDSKSDYRNVSAPIFGVASDVAMGIVAVRDVLDAAMKGKNGLKRLSDVQQKALLTNMGYLAGGAPTNAIFKLAEFATGRDVKKVGKSIKSQANEVKELIDLYVEENGDDPEAAKFIEDLKQYKDTLLPVTDVEVTEIVPEGTKDIMRESLSGGKWDAYNADSGAAGVYQFTESRWNEVMDQAPFLGLTENGRVSKDSKEQEKAMDWNMKDISRNLLSFDIPINNHNIYGAHRFGLDNFIVLNEAKPSDKLSDVLGTAANDPLFKDFKTVKSLNKFIDDQLIIDENSN